LKFRTQRKTEIRSALIAAVVAIVVAAPLSNAAHEQASVVIKKVTGKQGKQGKRGPRGFTGAQGEQGPRGLTGARGPAFTEPNRVYLDEGETELIVARCPYRNTLSGEVIVESGLPTGIVILKDGVAPDESHYFAVVKNTNALTRTVSALAECDDLDD
jgi:hypothetical protein